MYQEKKITLWQLTAGQRLSYVAAIGAMVVTNLCMFGAPLLGAQALDVIHHRDLEHASTTLLSVVSATFNELTLTNLLWTAAILSLLVTTVGGFFLYLRGRLAAAASETIIRNLRETLFARLHALHAGYFDEADTGDLVQRCSSDLETVRVFLASDVIEIGRAIMLLICVMPILFAIHAELALWSIMLTPALVVGAYIFFSRVKDIFQDTDEAEGAMTANLQENLTGIRVVRAFARQDYEIQKFAGNNDKFRDMNFRLITLMAIYWSISDIFALTQLGIVLLAGGYFAQSGSLTIGELFAFMTCQAIVIWPVRQLGRILTDSGKAVISVERINHILTATQETSGITPSTGRATGHIEARNLSIAYSDTAPVIRDLSVTIEPGEVLAIVGPPGSGKTTLIRALLGLYPYQHGTLTVDHQEVIHLDRQWLRSQIGVVLQDPFLYSRSIGANLKIGRPNAPLQAVTEACNDAAILESIEDFPDGFEALVGERGVTLSGGQRQRLALARALLKDPPILVLDDSLSAVDTQTEALILGALARRKGRCTTLIIAHRLSSVVHADRIMVLDQGRVEQMGSHTELIAQAGPYRRLCEIQGALDATIAQDIAQTQETEHVR